MALDRETLSLAARATERRRNRRLAVSLQEQISPATLNARIQALAAPIINRLFAEVPKPQDGHTPTAEEVLAVAEPVIDERVAQIPAPKNGHTPTADEVLAVAEPVIAELVAQIPQPKDGETPTNDQLLALINPLVEKEAAKSKPENGKDGATIEDTDIDAEGHLILHMTDGRQLRTPKPVVGPMPKHQISEDRIRFQETLMRWGKWISLRGKTVVVDGGGSSRITATPSVRPVYSEALSGLTYAIPQSSHGIDVVTSVIAEKIADGSEVSLCWRDNAGTIEFESLIPMDGLTARIS